MNSINYLITKEGALVSKMRLIKNSYIRIRNTKILDSLEVLIWYKKKVALKKS